MGGMSRRSIQDNFLTEQFFEASMTIRLVVLLLKSSFIELFQAERAHEMLGMEFTKHGGDASTWKSPKNHSYNFFFFLHTGYGFMASGTKWTSFRVVMSFAVRQSVMIEKWSPLERLPTVLHRNKKKYYFGVSSMRVGVWIYSQQLVTLSAC